MGRSGLRASRSDGFVFVFGFNGEETHAAYQARRASGRAPNELMEQDAFDDMLGDVRDLDVLDLGCGDGGYGRELIERGCASYLGVDASKRMVALAEQRLSNTRGSVRQARIEDFEFSRGRFDVVLSRLTFHWIEDLPSIIGKIRGALRPGGRLAFSVEHPVVTCCAAAVSDGPRQHWLVDDYFVSGPRTARWFDVDVVKFHRSVEEYFQLLKGLGFRVVDLREAGLGAPGHRCYQQPMADAPIRNVSDTAHWVAAYRAWESSRPDALFRDAFAADLAGEMKENRDAAATRT